MKQFACLGVFLFVVSQVALGATYTWTLTGAAGQWNDPANWGGAGYPNGPTDVANFPVPQGLNVLVNTDVGYPFTVKDITIGGGTRTNLGLGKIGGFNYSPSWDSTEAALIIPDGGSVTKLENVNDQWKTNTRLDGMVTFNMNYTGTKTLTAISTFSGQGGIIKTGDGFLVLDGGEGNTYTGLTWLQAGRIQLSGASNNKLIQAGGLKVTGGIMQLLSGDAINDACPIELGGGGFNTGGNPETMGTLVMSGYTWYQLASTSKTHFADSSALGWAGTLEVDGYNDATGSQLFFGSSASALTAAQVAQVVFQDPTVGGVTVPGAISAQILASGEVVPVPEPATIGLLVLGGLGLLRRKS